MMPPGYNGNYQIVQSPGYVMILIEMLHDARIIPTDGRRDAAPGEHAPVAGRFAAVTGKATLWSSRPRTSTARIAFRGASENMQVTERFTRLSDDTITLRVHGRRSRDLGRRRGRRKMPFDEDQRTDLRARLPRRQLRHRPTRSPARGRGEESRRRRREEDLEQ